MTIRFLKSINKKRRRGDKLSLTVTDGACSQQRQDQAGGPRGPAERPGFQAALRVPPGKKDDSDRQHRALPEERYCPGVGAPAGLPLCRAPSRPWSRPGLQLPWSGTHAVQLEARLPKLRVVCVVTAWGHRPVVSDQGCCCHGEQRGWEQGQMSLKLALKKPFFIFLKLKKDHHFLAYFPCTYLKQPACS